MIDLTKGKELSLILKLSLPLVLANILQNTYNLVDTIIVGNYISKNALAAVGASFPIIYLMIALVIGIGSGGSVVVSQYFGAKQTDKVRRSVDTILISLFAAGIIVMTVGLLASGWFFRILDVPSDVIPEATQYLRIYWLGSPFFFAFTGLNSVLRGIGDTKRPLYFITLATVLNIILDIILVTKLGYGVGSVALATIIAQTVGFVVAMVYLRRNNKIFSTSLNGFVFDKEIFRQIIRIGIPTGIQQSVVAIGMIALMKFIAGFGTNAIAAYSSAVRIDSFANIPSLTFASALSSFVGQNIGANKLERVKKGLHSTILVSLLYCAIVTTLIIIFGNQVMSFFSNDMDVIAIGQEYLVIVSSFYMLFALMNCFVGLLRGAGASIVPMITTIFSLWLVRVPLAYILSERIGVTGIWWSVPSGYGMGFLLSFLYYKFGNWRKFSVIKHDKHEYDEVPYDEMP
ncbi:MAG: MATE family efflux transporter [Bacteroidales bacterium]